MTKEIAFCGIDGCGKSTQIKNVQDYLDDNGVSSVITKLEYMPLDNYGENEITNLLIQLKSGIEIFKHYAFIRTINHTKDYVLSDRHMLCYLAYAKAFDVKRIDAVKPVLDFIDTPDLTIYFDIAVEESLKRIEKRGKSFNRHEEKEYLTKVKKSYEFFLERSNNDISVIDASQSEDEVTLGVQKILKKI